MVRISYIAATIGAVLLIRYLPLYLTIPSALMGLYAFVFWWRIQQGIEKRPKVRRAYALLSRYRFRKAKGGRRKPAKATAAKPARRRARGTDAA